MFFCVFIPRFSFVQLAPFDSLSSVVNEETNGDSVGLFLISRL